MEEILSLATDVLGSSPLSVTYLFVTLDQPPTQSLDFLISEMRVVSPRVAYLCRSQKRMNMLYIFF